MQLQHRITKFFGKHSTGMLFLIPAVTLNAVFFIYPLFRVVQMSFYNWTVLGTSQYLALGNYERLFGDPLFWKALSNTLIYTIIVTPGILSQRLLWPCFSTTLGNGRLFSGQSTLCPLPYPLLWLAWCSSGSTMSCTGYSTMY